MIFWTHKRHATPWHRGRPMSYGITLWGIWGNLSCYNGTALYYWTGNKWHCCRDQDLDDGNWELRSRPHCRKLGLKSISDGRTLGMKVRCRTPVQRTSVQRKLSWNQLCNGSCTTGWCTTGHLYNRTSLEWAVEKRTFVHPGTCKSGHLYNRHLNNRTENL